VSGATKSIRDSQLAVQQVAAFAASQVENLSVANRDQQAVWTRISQTMDQYGGIFARVQDHAAELLNEISRHLVDYQAETQKGFETVVAISDEHFATATQRLGSAVGELDETLQGLSDLFAKTRLNSNGNGHN
jgi:hypothetical protein